MADCFEFLVTPRTFEVARLVGYEMLLLSLNIHLRHSRKDLHTIFSALLSLNTPPHCGHRDPAI